MQSLIPTVIARTSGSKLTQPITSANSFKTREEATVLELPGIDNRQVEQARDLTARVRFHLLKANKHGVRVLEEWVEKALNELPAVSRETQTAKLTELGENFQSGHASLQYHLQAAIDLLTPLREIDDLQFKKYTAKLNSLFSCKERLGLELAQRLMQARIDGAAATMIAKVDGELKTEIPKVLEDAEVIARRPEILTHARRMTFLDKQDLEKIPVPVDIESHQIDLLKKPANDIGQRLIPYESPSYYAEIQLWRECLSSSLLGHRNLKAEVERIANLQVDVFTTKTIDSQQHQTFQSKLEQRNDGYYVVLESAKVGSQPQAQVCLRLDLARGDLRSGAEMCARNEYRKMLEQLKQEQVFSANRELRNNNFFAELEIFGSVTALSNIKMSKINLVGSAIDNARFENVILHECVLTEEALGRFKNGGATLEGCRILSKSAAAAPAPEVKQVEQAIQPQLAAVVPVKKGFFAGLRSAVNKVAAFFGPQKAEATAAVPAQAPNPSATFVDWEKELRSSSSIGRLMLVEQTKEKKTTTYKINLDHAQVILELGKGPNPTASVKVFQQSFAGLEEIPTAEYDGLMGEAVIGYIGEIIRLNQPRSPTPVLQRKSVFGAAQEAVRVGKY